MAIALVGSVVGANATSVTPPTGSVGDLLIVFAYRTASNTAPSLPAGWTALDNTGGSSNAFRAGWKIATATVDSSGTWTNATEIVLSRWSGMNPTTPVGTPIHHTGTGTALTYDAVTIAGGSSSVLASFAAGASATAITTRTGFSRDKAQGSAPLSIAEHIASPTGGADSATATGSGTWITCQVEIFAAPRSFAIGRVTTTITARALGKAKTRALGRVTSTTTARPLGKAKRRTISRATVTATARALGRAKRRTIGRATVTATARPLGRSKARAIGRAATAATARHLIGVKRRQLGRAAVTATARALAGEKARAIGRVAQAATARALGRRKTRALGLAGEAASVRSLTPDVAPHGGTVTRPSTGLVVRPNTGTVTRPDTGTVTRP